MSLTKNGKIHKVSERIFVWDIYGLIHNLQKDCKYISAIFEYEARSWYLSVKCLRNTRDVQLLFCLNRGFCNQHMYDQTYKLDIKDIEGKYCWTSPVLTHVFSHDKRYGTAQLFSYDKRDTSWIASEGRLSVHLTFDPPTQQFPTPEKDVAAAIVNPSKSNSRRTTEVGTQTCSKIICNQGYSLNTDGVNKLSQDFKDFMTRGEDCDVTLNVKGRTFKAHKQILRCRSPVFDRMFQNEMAETQNGVVDIMDCEPDVFPDFLLYLYTGKLENVDVQSVVHLHYICRKYGVDDLASVCVNHMIDNLTVETFCKFVDLGLWHCELELIEAATLFLSENVKEIVAKDEWLEFFMENSKAAHELLNKALDKNKALEKGKLPRK